jgi:hypothetical protein
MDSLIRAISVPNENYFLKSYTCIAGIKISQRHVKFPDINNGLASRYRFCPALPVAERSPGHPFKAGGKIVLTGLPKCDQMFKELHK